VPTEYTAIKPDATILLYERRRDGIAKHVFDIFGKYSVYVTEGYYMFSKCKIPHFISYTEDLIDSYVFPYIETYKVRTDAWRVRTEIEYYPTEWIRITNSEWVGAWSKSHAELEKLKDLLVENIGTFYDAVAVLIKYTSNLFVVYADIFLRAKDIDGTYWVYGKLLPKLRELRELQVSEILESLFPSFDKNE